MRTVCAFSGLGAGEWFVVIQLLSRVWRFVTPWTAAHTASLSFSIFPSLLRFVSIELVIPSNHLILCCPLLLPSVFPNIRVFSNESALMPGGQSVGASASALVIPVTTEGWFPSGMTGFYLLAVQGTLKSLLQRHSSKASIPGCSAFFMDHLSHGKGF